MQDTFVIKFLFYTIITCVYLSTTSCKKCFTCNNICLRCAKQNSYIDFCNTDHSVPTSFDNTKSDLEKGGFICTTIQSSQSFNYCDNPTTANNLKKTYERLSYYCY
jgi:hypothetical protein